MHERALPPRGRGPSDDVVQGFEPSVWLPIVFLDSSQPDLTPDRWAPRDRAPRSRLYHAAGLSRPTPEPPSLGPRGTRSRHPVL